MRHSSRGFSPLANTDRRSSRLSIGRSSGLSWSLRWVIGRARSRAPRAMPAFPLGRSALRQRALLGGGLEAAEHDLPVAADGGQRLGIGALGAERRLGQLDPRALAERLEPDVDEIVAVGNVGLARGRAVVGERQPPAFLDVADFAMVLEGLAFELAGEADRRADSPVGLD